MVFSSVTFLFLFLPIVLTGYYLLPVRVRNHFLLFASLVFYYWGENVLVGLIGTVVAVNYFFALLIEKRNLIEQDPVMRTLEKRNRVKLFFFAVSSGTLLFICLGVNLLFLAYFKYTGFILENTNAFLGFVGLGNPLIPSPGSIVLPLGVSFFTFQAMSYTMDVYSGRVKANPSFVDFACYVTLFPQLVAGPIVRYRDIEGSLLCRRETLSGFSQGIFRFVMGLSKKVLVANTMAETADAVFALPPGELSTSLAWIGVICYTLQIYYDFSGYSDMAIGLGHMFGFRFLENFNYPYISRSIQEFWRRWHISLSSWFRDYLYIPLGGNRRGGIRTCCNLMIVFFLCGLWHGAAWNYVVWGCFHGLFLVAERVGLSKLISLWHPFFRHLYTLVLVMVGWVLFRAATLTDAFAMLKVMAGAGTGSPGADYLLRIHLDPYTVFIICLAMLFSAPVFPLLAGSCTKRSDRHDNIYITEMAGDHFSKKPCWFYGIVIFMFILCLLRLSSGGYNPFIYFRF
ncbi:MAG: MBOAT family protein [Desulfamplus sp.]|nr:MBOAT family protein [Desulfamplus sp.]